MKVLVIISTAEKEKAITGLMYATNAKKYKWLDDVKLIFFGPVENLIAEGDNEIQKYIEIANELDIERVACKKIAEDKGYIQKLSLVVKTEYVGELISNLLKEGYVPMVF